MMLSCGSYGAVHAVYVLLTASGSGLSFPWIAIDILCQGGIAIATLLLILEREAVTASAVRDSEKRYRHLFERNLAGVFRSRLDGSFIDCNDALCKMLGYSSREELQQNSRSVYFSPDERDSALASLRSEGQLINHELRLRRKDGSEMLALVNVALLSEAAAVVMEVQGTVLDVSEARRLQEQLLQSQKMEAVGRLAGGIAHDFNNLLMGISGQAELLLDTTEACDVKKGAERILHATDSAGQLTKKLLVFSRKQELATTIVDLNRIVSDTTDLIKNLIPKSIVVEVRLSPAACWVNADPVHIEQAVINLILNARDAMSEDGKLVLSTSAVVIDDDDLGQHGGVPAGVYGLISIADTGHGIPEQLLGRIFEPFFTTKTKERGTGLGLSIVYATVRQNGGHIRVKSIVDAGTMFSIYIPSAEKPQTDIPESHPCPLGRSNASCPKDGTALVVDDEEMIRTSVRAMLEHNGLTVVDCGAGAEAVRVASGLKERLALLVTDVVMPGMTGTELAQALVKDRPELPIIFMSGYAAGEKGHEQFDEAKFLQKPFSRAALIDAVCEGLPTCLLQKQAK
jgi:PAS domain S-box-containing protein